jgi:Tfp pilus assembly protein PilZ
VSETLARPERRHRRRTVRILTEYQAGGLHAAAYATTLGGGGLFIETSQPLSQQTPIVVCFRLAPGAPAHRVMGRVVFSHAPASSGGIGRASGMGIEFTDPAAASRVAAELERLP